MVNIKQALAASFATANSDVFWRKEDDSLYGFVGLTPLTKLRMNVEGRTRLVRDEWVFSIHELTGDNRYYAIWYSRTGGGWASIGEFSSQEAARIACEAFFAEGKVR